MTSEPCTCRGHAHHTDAVGGDFWGRCIHRGCDCVPPDLPREALPAIPPTLLARPADPDGPHDGPDPDHLDVAQRVLAQVIAQVAARETAHYAHLPTENALLRSILRKLKTEGGIYLDAYGPGRPDREGDPVLCTDEYHMADLTPAEAELFDAITTEETT